MRADKFFGISRPNIEADLTSFYDEVEAAFRTHSPETARELKYYSNLPMSRLPYNVRTGLISKYRHAIGFDEAMLGLQGGPKSRSLPLKSVSGMSGVRSEHRLDVSNIYRNLRTSMGAGERSAYGRAPTPFTGGDLLSNIYSKLNIQFKDRLMQDRAGLTSVSGALPSSHFSLGLDSIPSRNFLAQPDYTPGMLTGKSILTYDVETAGLSRGQIREIAYTRQAADGTVNVPKPLRFTPKEFNRGIVAVDGKARKLRDLLADKYGIGSPMVSSGDDFANGVTGFLKDVLSSDYIVGHNISGFDNEQMFVGLSRTNKYKTDKTFASLVDDAFEKVKTSSIDTLDMVKRMPGLANITTAPALGNSKELYSISNLLLNTDLIDHIGPDKLKTLMKYDPASRSFGFGLHHAEVDTAVTNAILSASEQGGLQVKNIGRGITGASSDFVSDFIREVQKSKAITPLTNLGGVDQITQSVLRKMVMSEDSLSLFGETPGSELGKLLSGNNSQRMLALKNIRAGVMNPADIRISAVEQEIIAQRTLGMKGSGFNDVMNKIGLMGQRSGNYRRDQVRARKAGLPFAGLSQAERDIGYNLSRATSKLGSLSASEARVAKISADSLVSRFDMFTSSQVQYVSKSGKVSLPAAVLRQAGIVNAADKLSLSIVDPSSTNGSSAVNLVKRLDDKSRSSLVSTLNSLSRKTDAELTEILGDGVAGFRAGMKDGLVDKVISQNRVAIGQIYGSAENKGVVNTIKTTFSKFFNTEKQLTDFDMDRIVLPALDMDYESGRIRTAGALLDKGLSGEDTRAVSTLVNSSSELLSDLSAMARGSDDRYHMATKLAGADESIDTVRKAYTLASEKIVPHMGKGLLGLATAGVGAVLFSRHRENKRINQTTDFQGYESPSTQQYDIYRQIQERIDSGYEGYQQTVDPLATSSVNYHLNEQKIGHSNYTWNRSNSIYGGVL